MRQYVAYGKLITSANRRRSVDILSYLLFSSDVHSFSHLILKRSVYSHEPNCYSFTQRRHLGGAGGRRPRKKKEKRKKKRKKEKKRKKGTMNSVKLLHIKCCFFQFFNSPVALKNLKKICPPPRKSCNDAPAFTSLYSVMFPIMHIDPERITSYFDQRKHQRASFLPSEFFANISETMRFSYVAYTLAGPF